MVAPARVKLAWHTLFSDHAHHFMVIAGRVDDEWQLVSAASGSSIPSTSSHQAGSRPTQQQGPHRQQPPASSSVSQHQSPVKGSGNVQNFPELDRLSNEELAALLLDDIKYDSLVDSIMSRSSVAQVCPLPFCSCSCLRLLRCSWQCYISWLLVYLMSFTLFGSALLGSAFLYQW